MPADPWGNYTGTELQGGRAVPGNMPPGFCTQVGGPGSGGTVSASSAWAHICLLLDFILLECVT